MKKLPPRRLIAVEQFSFISACRTVFAVIYTADCKLVVLFTDSYNETIERRSTEHDRQTFNRYARRNLPQQR